MSARRRILPIFVPHAGCPNDCVFCNQKRISGMASPATAKTVREELDPLPDGAGYELAFYGGSFTAIDPARQEELLAAAAPYREKGCVVSIRVSTRPDSIDEAALARLRRYGVETVELGAQSMADAVLMASGRGHTAADTRCAASMVKASGFRLILQMMTGLPGSDYETDIATAKALLSLRPDGVRIYPTVVIRDTALEQMWRDGRYREHTVSDAVETCAAILPLFEKAGIPVIRLGLNPTEELSDGAAVAGAYHPALGELVRSRILRNRAEEELCKLNVDGRITLLVASGDYSAMIGQHRENMLYFQKRFPHIELRVKSADIPHGEIQIQ